MEFLQKCGLIYPSLIYSYNLFDTFKHVGHNPFPHVPQVDTALFSWCL